MSRNEDKHDNDRDPATGEHTCGQPMVPHFTALMNVLAVAGAGYSCREIYTSLVTIAEVYRQIGGFRPFVADSGPDGFATGVADGLKERLAMLEAQHAAEEVAEQHTDGNKLPVIDAEFSSVDDRATAKRAYDALTPDHKKKFN